LAFGKAFGKSIAALFMRQGLFFCSTLRMLQTRKSNGRKVIHHQSNASDLNFLGNEVIEPSGVAAVVLETVRLEQFRQKLDRRPEVSADRQLLQCHHHVPSHTATFPYYFSGPGRATGLIWCVPDVCVCVCVSGQNNH